LAKAGKGPVGVEASLFFKPAFIVGIAFFVFKDTGIY
jgi:hypothetical protein